MSHRIPNRIHVTAFSLPGACSAWLLLLAACSAHALQEPVRPILDNLDYASAQAVEQRADLFMVRKFYPEAVQLYERLTRMDPKNATYFNKLGIAHHQNQNLRAARDAYRRAIRVRPNYPEPVNNLAAVEYARRNYRSAIQNYLKALQLSPRDAVVYSNLGTAYFAYKKYDYAMNSYRFALQIDPQIFDRSGRTGTIVHQRDVQDLATFNFYMAKTYAEMGQADQALQYLQKCYEAGFKDLRKQLDDKAFASLTADPRFAEFITMLDQEALRKNGG